MTTTHRALPSRFEGISSGIFRTSFITFAEFCKRSFSEYVSPTSEVGIRATIPTTAPNHMNLRFISWPPFLQVMLQVTTSRDESRPMIEHTSSLFDVIHTPWPKKQPIGRIPVSRIGPFPTFGAKPF